MPIPAGGGGDPVVPGSAQAWIEETRAHLLSGTQAERNSLGAAYTAGSGVLELSGSLGGIVAGVRLAVGVNTFYVRSVNTAANTASVFGGQEGTIDVDAEVDDLVWVAPRFTDAAIFAALNAELSDLGGANSLYQMRTATLTYVAGTIGYDLSGTTDLLAVWEVRAQAAGTANNWPVIHKKDWRLDRSADVGSFTSGLALQIFALVAPAGPVQVIYKSGFTALATTTSTQGSTGLPTGAYDIPPLGAAMRLMAPREIKRNFTETQSDTRRAAEVPPGAVAGSYRALAALRAERIEAEAGTLMAAYPERRW